MSQSFTSMDAGTQQLHDTMWNSDIPYKKRVKQIKDIKNKNKDVPVYPEPEGDPSY